MDDTTYITLSTEYMPALFRMAYSIAGNRADAEDAVQQTLMKAWIHRKKARPGAERAWMMRILVNESRSLLRNRRYTISLEEASLYAPPSPDPSLQESIRNLPENLRTPLLLKYMEGMTEKEVATAMSLPLPSVKYRLLRARKTLQKELKEEVVL